MIPKKYLSPSILAGCRPGTPVLLGLSGGADSSSLLDMLVKSGENVTLCHVNHGIRGDEADRDEEFCRELAKKYGIDITVFRRDVPAEAKETGEGLEEAARRIRYECFSLLMAEKNIKLLCTAHNADDNAETVLFNIMRGSAAKGGCGIPAVRNMENGRMVVRPILRLSKSEILEYCKENGLCFVTDSTNLCDTYSRNRIRLNVIPELKKINPDAIDAITRFSDSLTEDCGYLDTEAERFITERGENIPCAELAGLPRPVLTRVLTLLARKSGAKPEKIHIDTLADSIISGKRCAVTLPGSIIAKTGKKSVLTYTFDERIKRKRG